MNIEICYTGFNLRGKISVYEREIFDYIVYCLNTYFIF